METTDIQNGVVAIDRQVSGVVQNIRSLDARIEDLYSKAVYNDNMYYMTISSVSSDDENYDTVVSQAEQYAANARACRDLAAESEATLGEQKDILRGYRPQYERFLDACVDNISNISAAIEKLMAVANSKYGGGAADALKAARQKLAINKQYHDGCVSRLSSIDDICGSTGTSRSRVLWKR